MTIDRNAFIDNFVDELNDNIQLIDSGILNLKNDPDNEEELNILLRSLHTIKGSSRMLKFEHIEKIAHGLENVFKGVKEKRYGITKSLIQLVFVTTDYLKIGAGKITRIKNDRIPLNKLLNVFEIASSNEHYETSGLKLKVIKKGSVKKSENKIVPGVSQSKKSSTADENDNIIGVASKAEKKKDETIRIKTSKVDMINRKMNDLIVNQFQLKKSTDVLRNLEDAFIELQLLKPDINENNGSGVDYKLKENLCRRYIKQLSKNFSGDLIQLESKIFEVQEEILSLYMLPMEFILGNMNRMVQETAMEVNKDIKFTMSGTDIMIDKIILNNLSDPIIHLVRNSIDHGIESPDEREKNGKSRTGKLEINCSSEGGNIFIRIKDDGNGLDYVKIKKRAKEIDPYSKEDLDAMDYAGLNTYLFKPGFSTKKDISNLSGRGVGLDIVKHNIEKINGKITLKSKEGEGTEFILCLPISLATIDGFFISSAGEKFLIPSNFVSEIIWINDEDKIEINNNKKIKIRDNLIPVYHLSDILDKDSADWDDNNHLIIIDSVGDMIGIAVDEIIRFASLIYKPIPSNLKKLKSIQGIVFDENFSIVNILYIPEIMNLFKNVRNISLKKKFSIDKHENKWILVVDDSLSSREVERSILELENYRVETAVDGIDAIEKLNDKYFNLIITDLKMPRMDGLTLIENLRRDVRFKQKPVIVLSTSIDDVEKDKLSEVGVNSCILKSDFERGNLIEEVKKMIG